MSDLQIELIDHDAAFGPGESIAGMVGWALGERLKSAEVRLFWYTAGKGSTDVRIVQTARFAEPLASDARHFDFTLPAGPHSFSGRLVSVNWALELIIQPGGRTRRLEITVSPTGAEIDLATTPTPVLVE